MEKRKYDLRKKPSIGETWLLEAIGSYMSYTAIYRFDGNLWQRKLAHENCNLCKDFKTSMTNKEFKELFEKCESQLLGVLLLGSGSSLLRK